MGFCLDDFFFIWKNDMTCSEFSCHGSIIRGSEIFLLYIANFLWTSAILFFIQASGSGTADLRHFVFYAFAGRTGIPRWHRKSEVSSLDPHIPSFLQRLIEYKTSHWRKNWLCYLAETNIMYLGFLSMHFLSLLYYVGL